MKVVPVASLRVRVRVPLCRRIIWRERLRPMPVEVVTEKCSVTEFS